MLNTDAIKEALVSMVNLKGCPIKPGNVGQIVAEFERDLGDLPEDLFAAAVDYYRSSATWFPTPGQIREAAAELTMFAMDVPTPSEAWAQVIAPPAGILPTLCEEGTRLHLLVDGKTGREYWLALDAVSEHKETCKICTRGGFKKVYSHPAIAQTVERLGGVETLLTTISMEAADRARFMDAYKEIINKEKKLATMPRAVRALIEQKKQAYLEDQVGSVQSQIGLLTKRLGQ